MLIRKCDYCDSPTTINTKTIYGHKSYLCDLHNRMYGAKFIRVKLTKESTDGKTQER